MKTVHFLPLTKRFNPLRRVAPRASAGTLAPAVALGALALLAGCSRRESSRAAAPDLPPAQVRVATVHLASAPMLIETTGTIRPVQRAVLAAKLMGAIEEIPVTLGQPVHAGDVLAKLAAGEISARVLQARSQLNLARRDLDRERDLLTKGASTADMVKGLEDRLALTEAMVREAEVMLGYATVRAPFDGVVSRKLANAGDLAAPGQPLIEVEGTGAFQVETGLPDSLAGQLTVGTPLSVTVDRVTFSAPLAELSSAADPSAHTVAAKLTVPPGTAVRSGQFARVQVPGAPVATLLIPGSAVAATGQLEHVFVAGADRRAVLRLVKTGATRGNQVEILSGLDDGETVVVSAAPDLREGQPLSITQ